MYYINIFNVGNDWFKDWRHVTIIPTHICTWYGTKYDIRVGCTVSPKTCENKNGTTKYDWLHMGGAGMMISRYRALLKTACGKKLFFNLLILLWVLPNLLPEGREYAGSFMMLWALFLHLLLFLTILRATFTVLWRVSCSCATPLFWCVLAPNSPQDTCSWRPLPGLRGSEGVRSSLSPRPSLWFSQSTSQPLYTSSVLRLTCCPQT